MTTNITFNKGYERSGFESQRKYPNEQLIQFLATHFFSIPKKERGDHKILELGCGSGANLWMIAKEGFDTYGVDSAPEGLLLCGQLLEYYDVSAKLAVNDFRDLKYPDNYFDAIVDIVSLQHTDLTGHAKSFQEIMRCLKQGGRFFSWHLGDKSISFQKHRGVFLDSQTIDDIQSGFPLSGNGPTCFLNPKIAQKMLSDEHFREIAIERVVRTYEGMTQNIEYFAIQALK